MLSIFYINLFNYGFVYVLAPWDSRESKFSLIKIFFGGIYTDINAFWFNDVGILIAGTMVSNMLYPLIEFVLYWALRYAFRAWDQRSFVANDPFKTHSKTLQGFESIYAGPRFTIHYKYAFILNVTFVTFLFGPGLPILFPIGLLSLICLYIVERLMVAYSYQKPPMYDSTINTTTLNLLYTAPLIYAFSAAWIYSNQ